MNITKKNKKSIKNIPQNTKKTPKKTKNREKKGKRISRIIRERLQTSTKVEVCEYYELWNGDNLNNNNVMS